MFFSSRYPVAIYIQKKALDFYVEGNQKHLEFPIDAVLDGDIINPAKYEKLIEDFITAENIKKQPAILVLAEEILFEKTIPLGDIKLLDERIADFTGMIPVESGKLTKKSVELENNIKLFAANKDLFEKIMEILGKSGFEVLAVVPLSLYSADNELSEEAIKKIYQDKQFLKKTNFLSDGFAHENTGQNRIILTIILFLLVIISIMGFLLIGPYLKLPLPFFPLKKEVKLTQVDLKTSPAPVGTESAALKDSTQSATLDKAQLKVTVLNGTGIAGQAAKAKNLLTGLGLLKIETGNAQGAYAEDTVVVFSPQVANDLQEEIINLLQENFNNVSTQKEASSSGTDILITTGKPKPAPSE